MRKLLTAILVAPIITVLPAYGTPDNCTPDTKILAPASESLCWPHDYGEFVIESRDPYIWGIRSVARWIDDRQPGMFIHEYRGASCSLSPDAICIRVEKRWMDNDYLGYYNIQDQVIVLNIRWASEMTQRRRRQVGGHELLHALGFWHHLDKGLVGEKVYGVTKNPSRIEMQVLREWYE